MLKNAPPVWCKLRGRTMSDIIEFCDNWLFRNGFEQSWTTSALTKAETVSIPHNAVELPFDYFDETIYQRRFTYQKHIAWHDSFTDQEVNLQFDGVMADAKVYIDGIFVGSHSDGYTPFEIRLTEHLNRDGILLTICIDGSENPEIPPFGGQIDYLTYAGIYREVWIKTAAPVSIQNVKIEPDQVLDLLKSVRISCQLSNPQAQELHQAELLASVTAPDGTCIAQCRTAISDNNPKLTFSELENILLWSPDAPNLYRLELTLQCNGATDTLSRMFGFRTAEFAADGFRLNGEKLKLLGLNRHQSFPYSGYALGRSAQEEDAEILKFDLACNVVRTSHYPQSTWFLDHCDRIGLLVLEEIPGWQHIGGAKWKDEAVANVRRMIERDWNHPSVILWGVRINESPDDDAFYERTNRLAHELDTTRQTGGIRKHTGSTLLEDVYTFNDFVLGDEERPGSNRARTALRDQNEVTGLAHKVPYLITEHNGHMFPTKVVDQEQRQIEHVTRHLEIIDAAFGDDHIAGCIGWCMFDYNTHKDFGSGDRVCHHGVMTMYREPKFAAYAYASQGAPENKVILKPVTHWARGERNIGGTLPLMILTNCDYVQLRFASGAILDLYPDQKRFAHLPHPPVMLNPEDLGGSELGKWGMQWHDIEVAGYVDGKQVAHLKMVADPVATRLNVSAGRWQKDAQASEVRVSVQAVDQVGNTLPFFSDPVRFEVHGPGSLTGPATRSLQAGATACWIKTNGDPASVSVTVSCERLPDITLNLG